MVLSRCREHKQVYPPSDKVLKDNSSAHNNGQNYEYKSLVYIINTIIIITNPSGITSRWNLVYKPNHCY